MTKFGLIQEDLRHDPWKLFIACMMLNRTSIFQVRRVIWKFFDRWPTASSIIESDREEIEQMLQQLGMHHRRAKTIIKMSRTFNMSKWNDPTELPGIGQYAKDSYEIFCNDNANIDPSDKELKRYLEWKKNKISVGDDQR